MRSRPWQVLSGVLVQAGAQVAFNWRMFEHPRKPDIPRPPEIPDIVDEQPPDISPAPPPDIPPEPAPDRPGPQRETPGPK